MSRVIILLGAPGAGKGTQAVRLSAVAGLPHISTGDLFRANLAGDTELGQRARGYMESGQLVPDELVLEMLFDRVAQPDCAEGYVLDGFPRTLPQAEALSARLGDDVEVLAANLEVPDDSIIERASGRLVCKNCGNICHAVFSPPHKAGVCDNCGGELHQRSDDQPEVVRERLRVYHEQTAPLVDYYASKGGLKSVDGSPAPDEVFNALCESVAVRPGEGSEV